MDIFTSPEALRDFVGGFGLWAPVVFFLVQVLQVVVSLIPGNVTTLAGGAMFGFAKGMSISAAAIVTGSALAFALARKLGKPVVRKLVGAKNFERYEHLLSSGSTLTRVHLTLAVTMLLPFFPDDLICLLAGLTKVRFRTFLLLCLLCRPWGLAFSALIGSGALAVPPWGMAVIAAASVGLGVLSVVFAPKLEAWATRVLHKVTARFAKDDAER